MVARTPTTIKSSEGFVHRWEVFEAEVSLNDTITFPDFLDSTVLLQGMIHRKDTGATITSTLALNVLTVTGAATNAKVFGYLYGVKA